MLPSGFTEVAHMGTERRYKIVVAVDGSEDAPVVLAQALDQAGRHDRPEVHVLRVVEVGGWGHAKPSGDELEGAKADLKSLVTDELEDFAQGPGDWRVRLHVRAGKGGEEIMNLVGEVEPDLVVLGPDSRHDHQKVGAVAETVLRRSPVPVLLARMPDYGRKDAVPEQCPECVAIRENTEGERWFCDKHTGGYFGTSTLLMSTTSRSLGHGPMW
jgi:nucleotide-binding universal stress UspA family protein